MKNEMVRLSFPRTYSIQEFELIQQGYMGDMDSKWFIYFENECLSIYRGTREYGQLIFILKFKINQDHVSVIEFLVDANTPWVGDDGVKLVENIIESRFELITLADEKENVGPVSFWLIRGKLALVSQCTSEHDLMDVNTVTELIDRLIKIAADLRSKQS